jgi:hypothetical protein
MKVFNFLASLRDYKAWFFALAGALFAVGSSFTFDEATLENIYVMAVWYVMVTPICVLSGLGLYIVVFRPDIVDKTLEARE